ncbi:MAG: hypothetical protein GWM90_17460, partial [Gemmatimonadetes bacterium]|nr:hypothetical protein [Gemmatimonadota bacterium]NIQ56128.1 hypothetical protein [Gemmatimonadota bacterium]NIU76315.1 hypothetical protein [Gammaproteobacteria bacterium]NIX45814.1 hypothetical protein [Gemmatimonadota bacterium]
EEAHEVAEAIERPAGTGDEARSGTGADAADEPGDEAAGTDADPGADTEAERDASAAPPLLAAELGDLLLNVAFQI